MRLLRRDRAPSSLEERECYDHSYGDGVLGKHVDVVPVESSESRVELLDEVDGAHVTTERLKRQFAERLAARARRR